MNDIYLNLFYFTLNLIETYLRYHYASPIFAKQPYLYQLKLTF